MYSACLHMSTSRKEIGTPNTQFTCTAADICVKRGGITCQTYPMLLEFTSGEPKGSLQSMSGETNPRPADSASSSWKGRELPLTSRHMFYVRITFAMSQALSKIKPNTVALFL